MKIDTVERLVVDGEALDAAIMGIHDLPLHIKPWCEVVDGHCTLRAKRRTEERKGEERRQRRT